jgi:hypothetical protein
MRQISGIAFLVLLVVMVGMGAMAVPTQAQERVGSVPDIPRLVSMTHQSITLLNNTPLQVCQARWESPNRRYEVCRDLATTPDQSFVEGWVGEFIWYDGTFYERINEETMWASSPIPNYQPYQSINEAFFFWTNEGSPQYQISRAVTRVGTVNVGITPTTHYQLWILDESYNNNAGGQVVYDIFLAPGQANLPFKDQYNVRGSIEGIGEGEYAEVYTYANLNTAATVVPPPADMVQPASDSGRSSTYETHVQQHRLRR